MSKDMPIRVLMDYQAFVMQTHGGVSRIFAEIARKMPKEAVDLTLFGGVHVNAYFQDIQREKEVRSIGLRIPRPIGKQRILMPSNRVLMSLYASGLRPELVHYTYFRRTLSRRPDVREVMTVHDMTYELFPECFRPGDPTPERKRRMAEEVDGIICISENTKKDLLRFCDIPEERVRVIPHGNPMAGVVAHRPPSGQPPFILFVGRRDMYKNFKVLLDALAASSSCKEWHLVAFGGGAFSADEKAEIACRGLAGRVFHESGSDEKLAGFYETARLLVYPSKYEGFGLPPLEAMSRGCPVIVANCSSLPEVVGGAGLYFEQDDVGRLQFLIESFDDPSVRQHWVDKGLERAKLFSWERCARSVADFYSDIMTLPVREHS